MLISDVVRSKREWDSPAAGIQEIRENERRADNNPRVRGDGGDHLVVGEGVDYYSGGSNNDTINSLDGRPDTVSCGLGLDDQIIADRDLDAVYGDCER
jgi:Ca2+-binding RTX toxin-like protein